MDFRFISIPLLYLIPYGIPSGYESITSASTLRGFGPPTTCVQKVRSYVFTRKPL